MKPITRRIVLEAIGVAMGVFIMAIVIFELPLVFTFICLALVAMGIALLLLFRIKKWGWFRNVSQNQIDEKTEANISALSTLAFIASIALMMLFKHL